MERAFPKREFSMEIFRISFKNGKRPVFSLRMNTIAPHGHFKKIRIGENLVVNYNG